MRANVLDEKKTEIVLGGRDIEVVLRTYKSGLQRACSRFTTGVGYAGKRAEVIKLRLENVELRKKLALVGVK